MMRYLSLLLCIPLSLALLPAAAFADPFSVPSFEDRQFGLSYPMSASAQSHYAYPADQPSVYSSFPSSFDRRDEGLVTSVKNQGSWGDVLGVRHARRA